MICFVCKKECIKTVFSKSDYIKNIFFDCKECNLYVKYMNNNPLKEFMCSKFNVSIGDYSLIGNSEDGRQTAIWLYNRSNDITPIMTIPFTSFSINDNLEEKILGFKDKLLKLVIFK